ncbi:MAG TPA: ATP-binding protein [Chryseosolibacter sp.]|nr:ATP-binding protein [Chryseosolibacter sp.]
MKRTSILLALTILGCDLLKAQKNSANPLEKITAQAYDYYLNDPDKALALTETALAQAVRAEDIYYEGYAYLILSRIYWVKANYQLSTEYGFKALKVFQDSPYHEELASTLIALARTLTELGNMGKAHEFIREGLELGIRDSDPRIQAAAYRELSYLLTEQNQLDSALYYTEKGLTLYERLGDSLDMSVLYGRKSRIYFLQKRYEQSKDIAYRALLIDSLVGNRRGLGISYYQVGQNEYALGNKHKAMLMLQQSTRINSEIGNLNWQIKAHELLASFYLEQKKPALAAAELQKVSTFKDELYNSEKSGQVEEMQSLHELEAKENTIRLLEQENALKQQQVKNQRLFVAFLMVAVLFLTLLIFVLTRLRSIQSKTNQNLANQNHAIEQQRIAIQSQAENLQQLDQLKTKLFSVISHDLRGPISNLQSLLDMFTKNLMTADEFVALSGKLKDNLNVTQRTLENLLNWSLSQMGGIKTEQKKVDVSECLIEACRLMEESAARKKVILETQVQNSIRVWADPDQLQVVLRNLIHNAIKFSSFNDRVTLTTSQQNNECHVLIKDSGLGMTHQEIETIMGSKKYFSKAGTAQEKGTGLGLLLCKEFITRNGGKLSISSTLGQGTEVSFTLALAEHEPRPEVVAH